MVYGYARVSTDDQSTVVQVAALKSAGCEKIFKDDGVTGATMARPGLKRLLKALQPGDKLIVTKMDRLARSLKGLIEVLDDLKAHKIEFVSLGETHRYYDTRRPCNVAAAGGIRRVGALHDRGADEDRTGCGTKQWRPLWP